MAFYVDSKRLITKTIIHAGNGDLPDFAENTKVTFHFRTQKQDEAETILDDSRQLGKPMEIFIGKKFKMEAWEQCVKTMRIGEVARFSVAKSLVATYPWVSNVIRKALGNQKDTPQPTSHCCGGMMAFQNENNSSSIDSLMNKPEPLTFTIELLKAELPGEYTQESWIMNDKDKLISVPQLREEGNRLYRQQQYEAAAKKYSEALGRLEQLVLKEKPGDEEWNELDKMKIPLLLNYSQCQLLQNEYYSVIEHTTTVLEKDENNVKALFRRAKAHVGAWNPTEARYDFEKIFELDPSLTAAVNKELEQLKTLEKEHDRKEKSRLCGKIF
uniref:peptidylprolyl isomerase n=1 Tax=Strigamia maritima TaxID=126957 RepID=T1J6F3_STRMM